MSIAPGAKLPVGLPHTTCSVTLSFSEPPFPISSVKWGHNHSSWVTLRPGDDRRECLVHRDLTTGQGAACPPRPPGIQLLEEHSPC